MAMNPKLLRPRSASNAAPPQPTDPFFSNVSLLLHFDGAISDASNNSLAVTAEGDAALSTAQSKFGTGSCYFDADGDSLLLADSPLLTSGSGDFTAEAWIRPSSASGVLGIFAKRNSPNDSGLEFAVYSIDGYSHLVVSVDGTTWEYNSGGTQAIPAGEWAHVAFVKSGTTVTVYVNGIQSQSGSISGAIHDGGEPLYIGSGGYPGQFFDGYIDEVRVTQGIARYEAAAFTPPDAPFPDQ